MKSTYTLIQHESRELQILLKKVKALRALNDAIQPLLPLSLKTTCEVANLTQHELIFLASNASAATTVHHLTPSLLKKFKSHPLLRAITQIRCKVRPSS